MNLAPPKIMVKNEVNISYIHCSERTVETRVGWHCGWLLGPLWADSAKMLSGKRARVWQKMMGISLMCVDVRGRSGWKIVKNQRISPFFTRVERGRGQLLGLLGPIWPKFYIVNGQGYGNWWLEFRWWALTYSGATVEKPLKTAKIISFWQFFTRCTRICQLTSAKFQSSVAIS